MRVCGSRFNLSHGYQEGLEPNFLIEKDIARGRDFGRGDLYWLKWIGFVLTDKYFISS